MAYFLIYKLHGQITRELLESGMQNFQSIVFKWTQTYRDFQIYISVPLRQNDGGDWNFSDILWDR